jgi:hypothetical protein
VDTIFALIPCYETWHPWKKWEKSYKLFVLIKLKYYNMRKVEYKWL